MVDYRKYACDISGVLFKEVNRKGIRRERLAKELGISENQIKNYAYDSTKSATLENFLQVMINHRCAEVLSVIAADMGCCVYRLPETQNRPQTGTEASADALTAASRAVISCMEQTDTAESDVRTAVEKLLALARSCKLNI
ncbi:MAG: hypothetical protein AB7E96_00400 [Deferribacterales bacterium]